MATSLAPIMDKNAQLGVRLEGMIPRKGNAYTVRGMLRASVHHFAANDLTYLRLPMLSFPRSFPWLLTFTAPALLKSEQEPLLKVYKAICEGIITFA